MLDKSVQSMTKFKQIIGRGTRINEDFGKLYFTIMDFKKATELFADPDFDGDPVQIYKPGPNDPPVPPDDSDGAESEDGTEGQHDGAEGGVGSVNAGGSGTGTPAGTGQPRIKYVVHDVAVSVLAERVQYYNADGKLITESLTDYTRKKVHAEYATLDAFLQKWSSADQKEAILAELEEQGVLFAELAEQVGKDFDPFDLVCHVAFDQPPLTRRERAENVKKRDYFAKYGDQARAVLEALLEKYADEGIETIESVNVLRVQPLDKFGTPVEIVRLFGSKQDYLQALKDLEAALYAKVS